MSGDPLMSSMDRALEAELRSWTERGLERTLRPAWNRAGAAVITSDGPAIDFSSNDYLGLASDPRVVAALRDTANAEGVGATASRLIAGDHPEHETLEAAAASFAGLPAAVLFGSGFAANIGTIPALVGADDAIFADASNHASLIDGCRLSRASVHVYPHGDVDDLRRALVTHRAAARRALIVTDGLFSMDGDLADLPSIRELAREFDAWLYVDDAHALGCVGAEGRGTAEHFGLHVDVVMGTLGKAFGASGAFVGGSSLLCRHLLNRARSFVYSTAMPPAAAAAARVALRIAREEPQRRARLRANAAKVRATLIDAGATPLGVSMSHIVPVVVGDTAVTMRVGAALRAAGVLVGAVRPPTVADGSSRLRVSVSAAHTDDHIERLGRAFEEALDVR